MNSCLICSALIIFSSEVIDWIPSISAFWICILYMSNWGTSSNIDYGCIHVKYKAPRN